MKRKVYATILYHYLWMTMLACEQLRAYFLCHNYVPVFYHKSSLYSWLIQHFSKSRGMFHPLRTAQNFNIQFVVSLPRNTITTKITRTPVFWGYIYIYELDLVSIVEDTERTRFCRQTDWRTIGRTDRGTRRNQKNLQCQTQWFWSHYLQIWMKVKNQSTGKYTKLFMKNWKKWELVKQ